MYILNIPSSSNPSSKVFKSCKETTHQRAIQPPHQNLAQVGEARPGEGNLLAQANPISPRRGHDEGRWNSARSRSGESPLAQARTPLAQKELKSPRRQFEWGKLLISSLRRD